MADEEKAVPDLDPLEIPDYLQAKELDQNLIDEMKAVALPAKDAAAIATSLKRLGMKKVTAAQISELSALGIHFPPAAMLRLSTGGAAVTEFGLLRVYSELMRIFEAAKDKSKVKLVSQVAGLAKTLVANHKQIADSARKNLPRAVETQNIKAHRFPTLQVVFQNSSGETVVKGSEKTIVAQSEIVK